MVQHEVLLLNLRQSGERAGKEMHPVKDVQKQRDREGPPALCGSLWASTEATRLPTAQAHHTILHQSMPLQLVSWIHSSLLCQQQN